MVFVSEMSHEKIALYGNDIHVTCTSIIKCRKCQTEQDPIIRCKKLSNTIWEFLLHNM